MQQYLIEREIPGAASIPQAELHNVATHSNDILATMKSEGKEIEWYQSYIAGDKIYCIYNASSTDLVREHAKRAGLPANLIVPVGAIVDPKRM